MLPQPMALFAVFTGFAQTYKLCPVKLNSFYLNSTQSLSVRY